MRIITILIFSLFFMTSASGKANKLTEEQKIQQLISAISKAKASFERNGSIHSAKEAGDHVSFKYKTATSPLFFFRSDEEITAKNFIEKIASKSSSTGEEYYIIHQESKKREKLAKWLFRKLKEINSSQSVP